MPVCRRGRWCRLTGCTIRRKVTIASGGPWRVRSSPACAPMNCKAPRSSGPKVIRVARPPPICTSRCLNSASRQRSNSSRYPVCNRTIGLKSVDAALDRRDVIEVQRTTNDHAVIVRRPLAIAHQELIVHSHVIMFVTLEGFRIHHGVDLDAADNRPTIRAVAAHPLEGHRIETVEADRIVTRLVFHPVNRRFTSHSLRRLSNPIALRMQCEFWNRGAYGENAQCRAVLGELWILFQAARDRCQRQCRAERMTDNQNFIDIGSAGPFNNPAGEIVDPALYFGPLTIEKLPGKNRVIQNVIDS